MTARPLQAVPENGPLARVTGRIRRQRRTDHADSDLEDRIATVAAPTRFNVAAVLSPHGGTGKTTVALLAANAVARYGQVRTVVVDATPDYGALGATGCVDGKSIRTIGELLDAAPRLFNPAELRPYVTQLAGGAHLVSGGPDDPPLTPERIGDLLGYLAAFYEVAVLDCASGITSLLAQHALQRADQIALITTPQLARSNAATRVLEQMTVAPSTVVINRAEDGPSALDRFRDGGDLDRTAFAIPEDPELDASIDARLLDVEPLGRTTRLAVKELALHVASELR